MKPWLREGTMAKMREVMLGQSELEVQRKFNEWQKRMAGRVSEVDGRLERIKRRQGSGKVNAGPAWSPEVRALAAAASTAARFNRSDTESPLVRWRPPAHPSPSPSPGPRSPKTGRGSLSSGTRLFAAPFLLSAPIHCDLGYRAPAQAMLSAS